MKNLIAIFSICLILPSLSLAQNKVSKKAKTKSTQSFQLVPQIGTVVSSIRFKERENLNITPQAGLSVGVGLLIPNDLYTTFESGLFYSRNQYNVKIEEFSPGDSFVSDFDSVVERFSIPLLARIHPLTRGNGFFVKGGAITHVQFGVTSEGSNVSTSTNNGQPFTRSESFKGFFGYDQGLRPVVLDATLGLGYNFELEGAVLSTELAYQRGLIGLDIEDEDDAFLDSFSITMGMIF